MLASLMTQRIGSIEENPRFKRIAEFLDRENFDGFTGQDLFIKQIMKKGWGQDIAALSNMAEAIALIPGLPHGLSHNRKLDLMQKIIERALHPKVNPWKKPIDMVKDLGHFGYFLEHLNICLGLYHQSGAKDYKELACRVSEHLAQASLSQPNAHARLLPHVKMRWAADQAAIICSLWIFDQNNGTALHDEPANRWLKYMHEHGTHQTTGLFITEVMGCHKYSNQPRGCSHSYMVHYMSNWAPDVAAQQWRLFKKHMLVKRVGSWGFREYLPDFLGRMTPDSGPIINDVGIAATGLSLKVSTHLDDAPDARRASILKAAQRWNTALRGMDFVPGLSKASRLGTDLLASSIMLAGECAINRKRSAQK